MKKQVALLSAFTLAVLSVPFSACQKEDNSLNGKTVVVATSNIRGDIDKLPKISSLIKDLKSQGASVALVDTGNFLQGTIYSSYDSGETLVSLMKQVGYNGVAIGSHEFDFGSGIIGTSQHGNIEYEDGTFSSFLEKHQLTALSANIAMAEDGAYAYKPCVSLSLENGKTLAIMGVTDENASSYIMESTVSALSFAFDSSKASTALSDLNADYSVVLYNTLSSNYTPAVRSADKFIGTSSDDGFALSVVSFNDKGKIKDLTYSLNDYSDDESVKTKVEEFKQKVNADEAFKNKVATSVTLNGSQVANRSKETNLGDLFTDAIRWYALNRTLKTASGDNIVLKTDADHTVAVWNGGNLRDYLNSGDVTMKDIKRVLPFPNKIAVLYVTGNELIELLEAASQGLPYTKDTEASLAAFFQVSGLKYTVDSTVAYTKGEAYGKSWFKDASVGSRVTITEVNGKPLDKNATYAVIVSNAVANGMDANYIAATEGRVKAVSTYAVTDAVFEYIQDKCSGNLGSEYAVPQGRITVK